MKDKRNILIGILVFIIAFMAVGYATFATTLNINGSSSIGDDWNVEITNITSSFTGSASDSIPPSYTKTFALFKTRFVKLGDSATYTITIENKGNLDAKLNSSKMNQIENPYINVKIISEPNVGDILKSKDKTNVVIKVSYDKSITNNVDEQISVISGYYEYVQAD